MALRILHRFDFPTDPESTRQLVDYAQGARGTEACLEAEAYRGLRQDTDVAIVELWRDEEAYAAHLAATPDALPLVLAREDRASTEIYAHEYVAPVEGVWTAASRPTTRAIAWPARGEVRIAIQTTIADPEHERPALIANELETLREPGCLEFAWMRGIENPQHILLVEAWASQRIYDQHWILRRRTASAPPRQPGERTLGTNGAEFYRREQFRLLYGLWVPADETAWSCTVDWPA